MKKFQIITAIFIFTLLCTTTVFAADNNVDTDQDGVSDEKEVLVYKTDPNNPDTDGDGYKDWDEIKSGYSPLVGNKARISKVDSDNDGLNDFLEIAFGTDLKNQDTDGDGFQDGHEVKNGYDPLRKQPAKLEKKLIVTLKNQKLAYYVKNIKLGEFTVSTGSYRTPTPKGEFVIQNKYTRPWSKSAQLWMPWWSGFNGGKQGIHELPEWPNGRKEGASHLGTPVSHGCIRLGVGPAKFIYDWAPVGTKLIIKQQ